MTRAVWAGAIGAAVVWLGLAAVVPAHAACPPVPSAPWAGPVTHADIDRHVDVLYRGAWAPYLERLERQLEQMEEALQTGRTVVLRNTGETLDGERLAEFLEFLRQRLVVNRCLAQEPGGPVSPRPVAAPAAGTPDLNISASAAHRVMVAPREPARGRTIDSPVAMAGSAAIGAPHPDAADPLRLHVVTRCLDEDSIFVVRNVGPAWPGTGVISVYRLGDRQLVTQRQFVLAEMQLASLRIEGSAGYDGQLGVFVKPSWYAREFAYDAVVDCGASAPRSTGKGLPPS